MSIVKREKHGKHKYQGDRKGRPYNTTALPGHSCIVRATLAVALAFVRNRFNIAVALAFVRNRFNIAVALTKMRLRSHLMLALINLLLAFALLACDGPTFNISSSTTPTITGLPGNAQLNTWYPAARGMDVRYEDWHDGTDDDTVTIVRIDPQSVTLSVGYQPGKPLLMSQWMQQEHATAIINGGYFDQNDQATALVISNGHTIGSSYSGFGGMLSLDSNGHINLRSLRQQPYNSSEALTQAIQCSPMLVEGSKRTQFSTAPSQSRRSIVAMDKNGKLLFISSPDDTFTLDELANLLVSSDLSISTALNLDGGASTGLYVNGNDHAHVTIDSFVLLPLVVIVKEK